MRTELKTITPSYAKEILETKNNGNRKLFPTHVKNLAREMLEGRWKLNGDTIRFSADGLIDGQHRLAAVVLSQVTIQSLVVYDVSNDTFDTIDCGKKRYLCDIVSILGAKEAGRVAAAIQFIDAILTRKSVHRIDYSNSEMQSLYEKYKDLELWPHRRKVVGFVPQSVIDTCYYLFSQKNKGAAEYFLNKVLDGEGLFRGDPMFALRKRIELYNKGVARLKRQYYIFLFIKAWNCWRLDKKVLDLKFNLHADITAKDLEII